MIFVRTCPVAGLLLAIALPALTPWQARAVELEAKPYVVGTKIEAWYKPIVKLPKGWLENEEWTENYERLVLFENGDMSREKPMIYLRAHVTEDQPLEGYIEVAQERWRSKVKDSTIEPLADIARPGKAPIKMFLYKNPSQPEQAFELTAFVKDVDDKSPPNTVFLQAVLLAGSKEVLDLGRPAFLELLDNFRSDH